MTNVIWHKFESPQWLAHALVQEMVKQTKNAVSDTGDATWLLSGGSSPKRIYQRLAKSDLAWDKITCALTDERCLPEGHAKTNAAMIWSQLLKHHPEVNWVPIWDATQLDSDASLEIGKARVSQLKTPFSFVLLGMGPDGHTASLFPGCDKSAHMGLNPDTKDTLIYTQSPQYPQQRISLSLPTLLQTNYLALLIMGHRKREVLEAGLNAEPSDPNHLPIHQLIANSKQAVHVYWSAQDKIKP